MKLNHKGRERHNRRREAAVRKMLNGKADLKVVKGDEGYRLASSNGTLVQFGQTFSKESEAVECGQRRFGKKAKRIVKRQSVAA